MAFTPKNYDSWKTTTIKQATSAIVARFDALAEDGNWYYVRATSATTDVKYVALEAQTTTSSVLPLVVVRTDWVLFHADCNATPVQTDVWTYADLTDHDTLNESASSNDVFFIEEIVNATDKVVKWFFAQDVA